jgi:hypothetical protein
LNEDGVANVDERFWQELADTHAAFYNHNNAVDLSKLSTKYESHRVAGHEIQTFQA